VNVTFSVNKAAAAFFMIAVFAAFFLPWQASAQEAPSADFDQGEVFFMLNEPEKALPFLERAYRAQPSRIEGALYLAMAYEELEKFDDAITVYRAILPYGGDKTALIACNLGNIYFRKGNNNLAEQSYTAAIRADTSYAAAYLNRANTRIRTGSIRDALPDYERYIQLNPNADQRPQIERLINLIRESFAAEEIRRLMAQENSRADEERQQALNKALIEAIPPQAEPAAAAETETPQTAPPATAAPEPTAMPALKEAKETKQTE
jgi:tetratricopeptide (TPR) repeat protein